jgi:hypothetical protein
MSRRLRKLAMIERRWRERFGEPPALLTDPDLMLRVLRSVEADTGADGAPAKRLRAG